MVNYQVLKRNAVSQRVRELSCSQTDKQTDRQTNKQTTRFTFADPLASLIAQPNILTLSEFRTYSYVSVMITFLNIS